MSLSIIPSDLLDLNEGEKRISNKLKDLYKYISRDCYLYVKPRLRNLEPDFIIIDQDKGICIVEVKDWELKYIKEIDRTKVTTIDDKVLHNPVFRTNRYFNFAKGLFESDTRLFDNAGLPSYNLYSRVIFTKMNLEDLSIIDDVLDKYPTKCIPSNDIGSLSINELFDNDTCFINQSQLLLIRTILFPEIKIYDSGELILDDNNENQDFYGAIKALDEEQEKFAKRIPNGHYMVSGVPGSGKTVILLSRAIYLLKENPDWKIKIVTYNRSLVNKLKNRLNHLSADIDFVGIDRDNISVSTFHKLALDVATIGLPQNPTNDFWIRELPEKAFDKAQPLFDAMLIDEYQDFYDSWIKVCLKLTKEHETETRRFKNIFLAGDRLQSIYNPNEHSWSSIGIKIRGRSKLLKKTYRAGRSHIDLALKLLMSDNSLKREVSKFYEGKEGIANNTGILDEIEFYEGNYDVVVSLIVRLINVIGFSNDEILILTPCWEDANNLYSELPDEIKSECRVIRDLIDGKLIITTYHSSKGIESRICIMVNIDKIEDLKLIYVGLTRAFQSLYIHANDFSNSTIANQIREDGFIEADDLPISEQNNTPDDLPF